LAITAAATVAMPTRTNRPRPTAGDVTEADEDKGKAVDDMVQDPPSQLTGNNRDEVAPGSRSARAEIDNESCQIRFAFRFA
jgi:hypothetical protein